MSANLNVLDLVRHANKSVASSPDERTWSEVREYVDIFNSLQIERTSASLNIFTFHAEVPSTHRVINYVDVKHDHWAFDYPKLIDHFLWAGSAFIPKVHFIFVTGEIGFAPRPRDDMTVVRLPIDTRGPMFERVKAMAAYVHSAAFCRDTVFLDTDAYPNRSLHPIFSERFDVGVTYRTTRGFMPLNEGVILGSHSRPSAVQRFFLGYLGTYEKLRADATVADYYGNIDRWRGGQLSLNAVAWPEGFPTLPSSFSTMGATVRLFPCNDLNYWVTKPDLATGKAWHKKFVLHLKGDSKILLPVLADYQVRRAGIAKRVSPS